MTTMKKSLGLMLPAMRISFALVLLTSCILLSAEMLGFTPQESKLLLESRTKISETLALQMSILIPDQDIKKIQKLIRHIVKRNPDILSAGIRKSSGNLIFQSANHEQLWGGYNENVSTTTHVYVPISQNGILWGSIELRFQELKTESFLGVFHLSIFKLITFISLVGFFVFLVFMMRTLRQLDPTAVIPERVNAAFDTLAEGVIIVDEDEQILLVNKAFCDKTGLGAESLVGLKASELQWKNNVSQKSHTRFPWISAINTGKSIIGAQLIYRRSKNDLLKFIINASPILGNDKKSHGVLITLDDVSIIEEHNTNLKNIVSQLQKSEFLIKQQNKELSFLATRDSLTGCLNRRSYSEQFEVLFNLAKKNSSELSCIMVDLDHFKLVNDNYGHATGDEVIIMLAEILKNNTRAEDLVCRYGGEEFCLVLPDMTEDVAIKTAERIRLRVKDESAQRFENGPRVTVSIGIASLLDNPQSPGELNNYADEALYIAKESGRNQVVRWVADSKNIREIEQSHNDESVEQDTQVTHLQNRITELEEIATTVSAELEYNQSYDVLTGLPNQVLLYDRIHQAIERGYRLDQLAAVLILDIEKFSHINTTLGRSIGDQLLMKFSELLNTIFRKSDGISRLTISRVAGDEFAVLLTDISAEDQITWIVKRLLDAINKPVEIEGNTIHINTRIGISLYPTDSSSVEELMNHAITAKRYCKIHTTQFNYQFFDHHMQELSLKHLHLEKELHKAISDEQWHLQFQPKLDLKTRKIIGAEALIRWKHPKRGLLSPFEFIDFAEQRKLIIPIGDWVIQQACKQIKGLISQGINDFKIAINLSPVQLVDARFIQNVFAAIDKYEVPPRLFEFEVTETTIIDNIKIASETLKRLSARGFKIAIDDFGTGYSSLSYLKTLPVDTLKIDRSFIKDICHDNNDEQIVKTLISMAHSLDLKVVAEGVEEKEQLKLLNDYGCDEIQGYLLSKPVDIEELLLIIENPKHAHNSVLGDLLK